MRNCHSEIFHGVMGFGNLIRRPQIGFRQTFQLLSSLNAPRDVVKLLNTCEIPIPLKVLELELLDSLSWVLVVGLVVAMVVVMGDWPAV